MRKTHKRILGLLGLVLVAVATIFAAFLPGPQASAVSGVTDTITIRVVSGGPVVEIVDPSSGEIITDAGQTIKVEYQNVDQVTITLTYTDLDGAEQTMTLDTFDGGGAPTGNYENTFNLLDLGLGYGEYKITVTGVGTDGVSEDEVTFGYYPVDADLEHTSGGSSDGSGDGGGTSDGGSEQGKGTDDGDYTVAFKYDEDGPAIPTGATLWVTDEGGEQMGETRDITPFPTDKYDFSLSDFVGTKSGTYIIYVNVTYVYNGKAYTRLFKFVVNYHYWGKDIVTPDTGSFMGNLNISKTDYLVTGLAIFGIVGVCGFRFVAKSGKKSNTRKRR